MNISIPNLIFGYYESSDDPVVTTGEPVNLNQKMEGENN